MRVPGVIDPHAPLLLPPATVPPEVPLPGSFPPKFPLMILILMTTSDINGLLLRNISDHFFFHVSNIFLTK